VKKLIDIHKITKVYTMGDHSFRALDEVDLSIEQGDFVAIMGPSGSGKSTLMNVLGLLDGPTSGQYKLLDRPVESLEESELARVRRETIGFIFQQFHLLPRVTALENVALPLYYSEGSLDFDRAQKLLDRVGLHDRSHHKTHELSGGQQQRVAVARSLVNHPQILFADEPTGNLDSRSEQEVMEIIKSLNREGITIIMVTHEEEIGHQAKRLIRMRDGKIVSDERLAPIEQNHTPSTKPAPKSAPPFMLFEDLKQGLRSIASNKVRASLSMLGILIGVASVITMLSIGKGASLALEAQLSNLGSNLLTVRPGGRGAGGVATESGAVRLSVQDAQALKRELPELVEYVSAQVRGRAQATRENRNWNTTVVGVESDYEIIRASTPIRGRFFSTEDELRRERVAVIGTTVWRELFHGADPIGEMIKVNRQNFLVIGILPEKGGGGWRDPDDQILVPLETAMRRLLGVQDVQEIEVQIRSRELIDRAESEIDQFLRARQRIPPSQVDSPFRIRNMAEIQDTIAQSNRTMTTLLAVVAGVSLLVGGIGIMNIMLVSVTERTKEIGLRKAIGGRPVDILRQFLLESMVITSIGGGSGILLGVGFSIALTHLVGWPTALSLWTSLGAFVFSSGVGIIFGLYPARRASLLNPIEALRHD
jgi:macrolide transport system ATP-binding/permease protein